MKYFAKAFGVVFFHWLAFQVESPLSLLAFLASGLLLGDLAHKAYSGSKQDGTL